MELDESAAPYRGFLRSGSYPALSKRIVNSGGLLVRAAGWFALIVTAASAGYTMTQRFVAQSATAARSQLETANAAQARPASAPRALPLPSEEQHEDAALHEHKSEPSPKRTAALTLPAKRKQTETGAVAFAPSAHPQHSAATAPSAVDEPSVKEASAQADLIAERPNVLDTEVHPDLTVEAPVSPPQVAAVSDEVRASPFHPSMTKPAPTFVRAPAPPPPPPAATQPKAAALPLSATARIDELAVHGSLTSANLRHGLERVQPALSECYASAARRAGENRFSNVRVIVQLDEAGRVKTQPSIEGAQLPGLQGCLSSAFSKLVCRAPDTGTAKASMTVHFGPMVLAASAAKQRR